MATLPAQDLSVDLRAVTVRPTWGAQEHRRWDRLVAEHHYLPFHGVIAAQRGERRDYLVARSIEHQLDLEAEMFSQHRGNSLGIVARRRHIREGRVVLIADNQREIRAKIDRLSQPARRRSWWIAAR